MPKAFNDCRAAGGQIRTKVIEPGSKYMHICILNGKTFAGDVKTYKKVLKGK